MITITTPPEPLDRVSINTEYWHYWCSLFTSLNIRLFGLTDIAWLLIPAGDRIDDIINMIRPFEDILNAHAITNGVVVITLASPRVPYKPARACKPPNPESYYTWARIASNLANNLGEELVRHAYTVFLILKPN